MAVALKYVHILIPNPHGMAVALKYVHVLVYFEVCARTLEL